MSALPGARDGTYPSTLPSWTPARALQSDCMGDIRMATVHATEPLRPGGLPGDGVAIALHSRSPPEPSRATPEVTFVWPRVTLTSSRGPGGGSLTAAQGRKL